MPKHDCELRVTHELHQYDEHIVSLVAPCGVQSRFPPTSLGEKVEPLRRRLRRMRVLQLSHTGSWQLKTLEVLRLHASYRDLESFELKDV